jgi:cytochrome c oxidase subunit IV
MSSEKIGVRIYVMVFVALLVLTVSTTAVAFVDLGATWNSTVALVIAIVKALLVILFFMHVLYSRPLTWVFVGIGFFWLAILFALTLADYVTRDDAGAGPLAGAPAAALPEREQGRAVEIVPGMSK